MTVICVMMLLLLVTDSESIRRIKLFRKSRTNCVTFCAISIYKTILLCVSLQIQNHSPSGCLFLNAVLRFREHEEFHEEEKPIDRKIILNVIYSTQLVQLYTAHSTNWSYLYHAFHQKAKYEDKIKMAHRKRLSKQNRTFMVSQFPIHSFRPVLKVLCANINTAVSWINMKVKIAEN